MAIRQAHLLHTLGDEEVIIGQSVAIRQAHLLDRAYKLPFDEEESIADDKASGRCSAACGDRAHDGAEADLGEGADLMREAISMHSEELTTAPKPGSLSAMVCARTSSPWCSGAPP